MNMLHDTNFNNFRKTIMSLGNVMLRHFKDLFVVFAGNYCSFAVDISLPNDRYNSHAVEESDHSVIGHCR